MTTFTARGDTFIPERDSERLSSQYEVVKAYVLGRDWTTLGQISKATGYPEASVSARLRDLRGRGYLVEREFVTRGLHRYKVSVINKQLEMFTTAGSGPLPNAASRQQSPAASELRFRGT